MNFLKLTERKKESSEPSQDQDNGDEGHSLSFLVEEGSFHDGQKKEEEGKTERQIEKEEGVFFER